MNAELELVPYQVNMERRVRDKAIKKARTSGSHLSKFVVMAIEKFVDDPIEKSMKELRTHNNRRTKKYVK